MKTKLPADQNADGAIDLLELDLYITHRVKELTNGKQRPVTERGRIPVSPLATP